MSPNTKMSPAQIHSSKTNCGAGEKRAVSPCRPSFRPLYGGRWWALQAKTAAQARTAADCAPAWLNRS
jgi:hypothetical protein